MAISPLKTDKNAVKPPERNVQIRQRCSIKDLNAWLADIEIKPEKKKKVSSYEISRNCAHCDKEVRAPRAENPNERGEYTGVICVRCYEAEIEAHKRDEAHAKHMNRMQSLRDQGVVVLEDYKDPKG